MDKHTKEQRSYNMSRIKSSETKLELRLKPFLKKIGFIYQPKNIPGKPDFANKKEKVVIFIDGCFWHGCPKHYKTPKSNFEFWKEKINKNVKRDRKIDSELKKHGWKVLRVWEHQIKGV